jgi:hypothetical protein
LHNIGNLGKAIYGYHEAHKYFPPSSGVTRDAEGKISAVDGWSWMVMILPYMEERKEQNSIGLTSSPIGKHGPDLVALKIDFKKYEVEVLVGEVKAMQSSRIRSALDRTVDEWLQMSFNWVSYYASMIAEMVAKALSQALAIAINSIAPGPAGEYVKEMLARSEIDLYLLRARYYEPDQWDLRGFRLLHFRAGGNYVRHSDVGFDKFDENDELQQVKTVIQKLI